MREWNYDAIAEFAKQNDLNACMIDGWRLFMNVSHPFIVTWQSIFINCMWNMHTEFIQRVEYSWIATVLVYAPNEMKRAKKQYRTLSYRNWTDSWMFEYLYLTACNYATNELLSKRSKPGEWTFVACFLHKNFPIKLFFISLWLSLSLLAFQIQYIPWIDSLIVHIFIAHAAHSVELLVALRE